jgi:hypothetical protein
MTEADSRAVVEADPAATVVRELGSSATTGSASGRGGDGAIGVQRWELPASSTPRERS